MTAEYAQQLIQEKDQKEKEKWAKQLARAQKLAESRRKRELKQSGVLCRRIERLRIKALRVIDPEDISAAYLSITILDPKKEPLELELLRATIPKGFKAKDP